MKRFLCVLIAIFALTITSYGAAIDSLDIHGDFCLSGTDLQIINRIPESVVSLYHIKGGEIYFVQSPLEQRYGYCDSTVLGLYYFKSKRIYVRNFATSESNYGAVLAHELGHFLFHDTFPSWPKWVQNTVLSFGNEDPDESFACFYHTYCTFGTTGIPEVDSAICEIHAVADRLYRRTVGIN